MQKPQATAVSTTHIVSYSIFANLGPNSRAQVRCYEAGAPLFAALTREFPGDFARWEFHPAGDEGAEGLFTIKNIGLNGFVVVGDDGALVVSSDGADPAEFRVQAGEDGSVLVCHQCGKTGDAALMRDAAQLKHRADLESKVWSVQGEGIRANIVIHNADGSSKQNFTRVAIED